ncbi:MAG: cytidine deaminase [Suilimivivens sp.]
MSEMVSFTDIPVTDIPVTDMIQAALHAREKAYTPYSHYQVGAALLTRELRIYTGCNIENAAYSPGICAERTAIAKAVSEGWRKWKAIAIVGGPQGEEVTQFAFPCGVCRQVIREFVDPDEFVVIIAKNPDDYKIYRFCDLFPEGFGPENLRGEGQE